MTERGENEKEKGEGRVKGETGQRRKDRREGGGKGKGEEQEERALREES